jgi:uncharacterized protein YkwD
MLSTGSVGSVSGEVEPGRSGGVCRRGLWGAATWWVLAVVCAVACTPAPAPSFGSGLGRVPASGELQQQERAMFDRLNRDREARGLPALRFDARLSEVARHHSGDMRDHGFFEHESPRTGGVDNRLDAAGYLFLTARENLSEAPDVERSQDGLLASPHHFENIMAKDVTHVGIGIVSGGVQDPRNLTVTQVFARPVQDETPERARGQLLQRLDRERSAMKRPSVQRDTQLMELAAAELLTLDEVGSASSVERAGERIAAALQGEHAGSLLVSAQVVPSSEQVAFPDALLQVAKYYVGLAVRRVQSEQGRPALQVLLLAVERTPKR